MNVRVTSNLPVGRGFNHPCHPHPRIPLPSLLSFIFPLRPGAAYPAFSTSYPAPHSPTLIQLYLLPRCHTVTLGHMNTHIPSTCSPVSTHPHPPSSSSSSAIPTASPSFHPFLGPEEAAGGPWPILSHLWSKPWHTDMAGRQTGGQIDRQLETHQLQICIFTPVLEA